MKPQQLNRFMLKSKIHRATLTGVELDYEGSITIDSELLGKTDILPGEQVHVVNINNGSRLVTYVLPAATGSGIILLNGAAARCGSVGDKIIIMSYCLTEENIKAKIVFVDDKNKTTREIYNAMD